jgi:hypothetical protein
MRKLQGMRGCRTCCALADAIAETLEGTRPPLSERHLRYLSHNTTPLTADNRERKPSLVTLGLIIRGLRHLTGEDVQVSDLLQYEPSPDESSGAHAESLGLVFLEPPDDEV